MSVSGITKRVANDVWSLRSRSAGAWSQWVNRTRVRRVRLTKVRTIWRGGPGQHGAVLRRGRVEAGMGRYRRRHQAKQCDPHEWLHHQSSSYAVGPLEFPDVGHDPATSRRVSPSTGGMSPKRQ